MNNQQKTIFLMPKLSFLSRSVVTGIRFIEHNKAIYPQIEVGRLLPLATINKTSVFWLDVPDDDNFAIFNYDVNELSFGDPSRMAFSDSLVTGKIFFSSNFDIKKLFFQSIFQAFNSLMPAMEHLGDFTEKSLSTLTLELWEMMKNQLILVIHWATLMEVEKSQVLTKSQADT